MPQQDCLLQEKVPHTNDVLLVKASFQPLATMTISKVHSITKMSNIQSCQHLVVTQLGSFLGLELVIF